MKTFNRFALILATAAITAGGLLGFASSATAARPAGPGLGHPLERAKEKLGLTDDQASQIKAVLKGDKETITSLLSRLQEARNGLREAIRAADANESSVRAASAKIAAVEADLAVERLKLFGKISPILTPEQREKLQAMQAQLDEVVERLIQRFSSKAAE